MPRLSKLIEKLEDKAEARFGAWFARYKAKLPYYIPLALLVWYIYGLFLNSLRLGIASTFGPDSESIGSIWISGVKGGGQGLSYAPPANAPKNRTGTHPPGAETPHVLGYAGAFDPPACS